MFSKPYSALQSQKVVLHEPHSFVCEYLFKVLQWTNCFVPRPFYRTPNHPLNDRVHHAHTPVSNPTYLVALKSIIYQHINLCTVCITSVTWNNCDVFTAQFSLLYFKLNQKPAKLTTIHYFCTTHDYVHYWIRRDQNKIGKHPHEDVWSTVILMLAMGRGGEGMIHEPNQQISCQYNMCWLTRMLLRICGPSFDDLLFCYMFIEYP